MTRDVVICECFARDGLQHEPQFVPTDVKVKLIDAFSLIGFERIEATSYSNPKVVPAFADASEVLARITRRTGVFYKATCANLRAVERAVADHDAGFGASEISLLASASEGHSERNLRQSRAAQWKLIGQMAERAGRRFRIVGSLSVVFGCPIDGRVDPSSVVDDIGRFAALGVTHVSLGDTTGLATPNAVAALANRLSAEVPDVTLIAHFHDTRGSALANCMAAFDAGITHFDSSIGGVGGHPAKVAYGEGHTGNVATEDLVNLFEASGIRTGLNLPELLATAGFCADVLGREFGGRVARAGYGLLDGIEVR